METEKNKGKWRNGRDEERRKLRWCVEVRVKWCEKTINKQRTEVRKMRNGKDEMCRRDNENGCKGEN